MFYFYHRKTSEYHRVFKSFQEFKNETSAENGYVYTNISHWFLEPSETIVLENLDIVNEFHEYPACFRKHSNAA